MKLGLEERRGRGRGVTWIVKEGVKKERERDLAS